MQHGPSRVLVVDDDVLFQKIASRVLSLAPAEVVVAADGEAAIGALEREPFDCVVVDLGMPRVGGFAVIRRMKDDVRLRSIPVLVITSNDCAAAESKAAQLGVSSFLAKPVNWRALPALVAKLLEERRAAAA